MVHSAMVASLASPMATRTLTTVVQRRASIYGLSPMPEMAEEKKGEMAFPLGSGTTD
jgi:hypothetical protein